MPRGCVRADIEDRFTCDRRYDELDAHFRQIVASRGSLEMFPLLSRPWTRAFHVRPADPGAFVGINVSEMDGRVYVRFLRRP